MARMRWVECRLSSWPGLELAPWTPTGSQRRVSLPRVLGQGAGWAFSSRSSGPSGRLAVRRSGVLCSPPHPRLSDTSSHFLPAAASLSPAWPGQPDQPPPREHIAHTVPPRVTTGATAVPTVSAPAMSLSSKTAWAVSQAQLASQHGLLRWPWPGHSGGSQALPSRSRWSPGGPWDDGLAWGGGRTQLLERWEFKATSKCPPIRVEVPLSSIPGGPSGSSPSP